MYPTGLSEAKPQKNVLHIKLIYARIQTFQPNSHIFYFTNVLLIHQKVTEITVTTPPDYSNCQTIMA